MSAAHGPKAGVALGLTACEREPIHIPGALLALPPTHLTALQVIANTAEYVGNPPEALRGTYGFWTPVNRRR